MFVAEEQRLDLSFAAARTALAALTSGGSLLDTSKSAYGDGATGLVRVGPLGPVAVLSRLVEVRFRELPERHDCAGLALRWEAIGPAGALFPVLDADITVTPDGERATTLRLAGVYRPPLGQVGAGIDQAVLHRVAEATIRSFVDALADAITRTAGPATPKLDAPFLPSPP